MSRLNYIYTIFFTLLLLFSGGCDKLIYDTPVDDDTRPAVYLSINYGGASKLRSSVDEPGDPTINVDGVNNEDRVHDLAMLVFESGSSGKLVSHYYDNNIPITEQDKKFIVKLTPGTMDFYFVANMDWTDVTAIKTKSQMENYLKRLSNLDSGLYSAATTTKGFPMARVYKNQVITQGGTITSPTPFKPDNDDYVLLRRVVAQVQVNIAASDIASVKDLYYRNAFQQYSLVAQDPNPGYPTPVYYQDNVDIPMVDHGNGKYHIYVPEALMDPATTVWGTFPHKPINYFVIETMDGVRHDIPILTYGDAGDPIPGGNYMKFAKGEYTEDPDYNVYRNRRYVYEVFNISKGIEIDYAIDPWKLVETSLYMGYGYNVSIENGIVKIANTIDACEPHVVRLEALDNTTINNSLTSVTFDNFDTDASQDYNLHDVPESGDYLEVYFNDKLVKTFSK